MSAWVMALEDTAFGPPDWSMSTGRLASKWRTKRGSLFVWLPSTARDTSKTEDEQLMLQRARVSWYPRIVHGKTTEVTTVADEKFSRCCDTPADLVAAINAILGSK